MIARHTPFFAALLLGLIALLGFHSCSTPEEVTADPDLRSDSIGDIRCMYGVPTRTFIHGK